MPKFPLLPLIALSAMTGLLGAQTHRIDFGTEFSPGTSGWNGVSGSETSVNLFDDAGNASALALELTAAFAGSTTTPWSATGLPEWPDGVGGDYLYLTEENPVGEFELRNVPDSSQYRLWLLSRTENGAEAASRSSWTVNGLAGIGVVFNSAAHLAGNSDQALEWRIVKPLDGRITIRGEWQTGERAAQLNGIILEDMTEAYDPETFYTEWVFPFDGLDQVLMVDSAMEPFEGSGDGSASNPYRSIQTAVDRAQELDAAEIGVHILIRSGVYREEVVVRDRANKSPLVLEAEESGRVILLGSDRFTNWQPASEAGVWEHAWPHKFGWEANPWPDNLPLEVPGFRRELLYINGAPYRQVLQREHLTDRTYFVSEAEDRILLDPAGELDPREEQVEVSVRPGGGSLLRLERVDNVAVLGLRIQHAATAMFSGAALSLRGAENVLVEDTDIHDNNGIGLEYNPSGGRAVRNVVLRNVHMDRNGTLGMTGVANNLYVENCSTSENNWRGFSFGVNGWAPCGFKMAYCANVRINGLQVHNNHATGAWFDMENRYILVENMYSYNNYRHGSSLEANFGPLHIRDSVFAENGGAGVNAYDNSHAYLSNSVFFNNADYQIRFSGRPSLLPEELPSSPAWFRERQAARQIPSWYTLEGNLVGVEGRENAMSMLYDFAVSNGDYLDGGTPRLERLQQTWASDQNRFFHPYPARVAAMFSDLEGGKINYADYQARMHADASSEWLGEAPPTDLAPRLAAGGREPSGYAPFSYAAPATTSFIDPSERSAIFGMRVSEWYGWMHTHEWPWLYHYEHGWQFVQDQDTYGAVLFDSKLGWIFAGRDFYPVLYAYALQDWVLYQKGGLPERRWILPLGDADAGWIVVE
jgi:hypothetical protein